MASTASKRAVEQPRRRSWVLIATFFLLLLTGLGLAVPGMYLAALGGSLYYVIAGILILLSSVLILRSRRLGLYLYGFVFLATLIWGLWEVGLDGWGLMPRLVYLAVGGIWLLLPIVRNKLRPHPANRWPAFAFVGIGIGAVAIAALGSEPTPKLSTFAEDTNTVAATADGEWPQYGNSIHGTRYSPLAEITPANVSSLEQAWVYRPGATIPGGLRKGGLQVTPLMVDGTLYGCTAFNSVFALDPVTGRQLWRFDPKVQEENSGGHPVCRGMAFFRAPPEVQECSTRLLMGTVDNRLIAIDAKTGKPCADFGTNGEVSLLEGLGDFPKRWSHPTSPPTIVNGTAVIGAFVIDNQSTQVPPGVVRGYDAVTGRLKWAFDPARPDDQTPLPPGGIYTPSTPNFWSVASGDEALGLIYLPMGNGSPDFVGGHRSETTERFSTSVIALDAATGAVRWTFQAIHHDMWDYDLASQPVLTDFPVGNATVPALLLPTKTGQIFVLDRRTGQPLTKVEERPVPPSEIPGERASPTQPFSVDMPDFAGKPLAETDMWGLTPFDQLYCRIKFRQARYDGMFTPPRLGPTIRYPGELGGLDWGSVSVDEGRGILVVNSNHMSDYDELITRAQAEKEGLVPKVDRGHNAPGGAMAGTPYAIHWGPFLSGFGVPCQRPPYGFLTAVDLKTRKAIWQRPIGDARNSGPFGIGLGLPLPLGAPNIGGSLTTGGGVIFIAATQDEMFRAIDVRSGKTLWQKKLPVAGNATPMTYRGADGHQYVLIAAGGGSLKTKSGDYIIAYRLKQ